MPNKRPPIIFLAGIFFLLNISCQPIRLIAEDFAVTGVAYTSKIGAMVWVEKERKSYFLDNVRRWPEHLEEKKVEVKGVLFKEKTNLKRVAEDGSTIVVSGVKGHKWFIKNATWRLVE